MKTRATSHRLCSVIALASLLAGAGEQTVRSQEETKFVLKTEHFDRDPGWEGHNNRIVPKKVLMVKQNFGFSATHVAGKAAGEIGGVIQRSTTPASYAAPLTPAKTLDDKLTASGSFAVNGATPGAGVFFGFFNSQQPGGQSRQRLGSLECPKVWRPWLREMKTKLERLLEETK